MARRKKQTPEDDKLILESVDTANSGEIIETAAHYDGEVPSITDPHWTDYVLSLLSDEEIFDGCPRVDGLRRLVELLISPIQQVDVDVQTVLSPYLVVIAKATVHLSDGRAHAACVDASYQNTTGIFRHRLSAMADSRAKAKAYREILRLRNVYSTEEAQQDADVEDDGFINDSQVAFITTILPRKIGRSLNIEKLISIVLGEEKSLRSLKHSEAVKLSAEMNSYINSPDKIPEEVLK